MGPMVGNVMKMNGTHIRIYSGAGVELADPGNAIKIEATAILTRRAKRAGGNFALFIS